MPWTNDNDIVSILVFIEYTVTVFNNNNGYF